MQRTKILLLFGGESSEHEVSISSARNVFAAIDDTKFEVILGYIDASGRWWLLDSFDTDIVTHTNAAQIVPVLGTQSLITLPSSNILKPDVILPILHGENGEDGSVQGLAQLLHIPIVGCDMTASAICMYKLETKEILDAHSIAIAPYDVHRKYDSVPDFNHLSLRLGSPMFVKPARAGSSVGVSKVYSEDEMIQALDLAHQHDNVALIERGIAGRELEVAILGNPPYHQASGVGEIKPGADFYSYDAKYSPASSSQTIISADLDESTRVRIQQQAKLVYEILGCKGLARVDFFLTDDGMLYVNEVNTLPGFTNISMYPKLWRHAGIGYSDLIETLITDAILKPVNNEEVIWTD
jgi:D-alanine-D-alanine ligase